MTTTSRRYAGLTARERTTARRGKLIEAGRKILLREGIAKTTVTAVCAEAALTERYFYESFANRDVLLDAVFAEIAAEGAVKIFGAAAAGPDDPRERLRIAFTAAIDILTDDLGLGRVMTEIEAEPTLLRHRAALTRKVAELSGQYAHLMFGPRPYEDVRARMAILFVVGGCAEIVSDWMTGRLDVTRDQVVETCTDLLLSGGTVMLGLDPQ